MPRQNAAAFGEGIDNMAESTVSERRLPVQAHPTLSLHHSQTRLGALNSSFIVNPTARYAINVGKFTRTYSSASSSDWKNTAAAMFDDQSNPVHT